MSAAYKVDNLEGGILNLNALLSVICELRFELATGEDDPRIDNLLWIARDISVGVVERFEEDCRSRRRATSFANATHRVAAV